MSLINDALKRAQTDVDRGRMNPVPLGMSSGHTRSHNQGSWVKILIAVLLVGAGSWAVILLLSSRTSHPVSEPVHAAEVSKALVDPVAQTEPATVVRSVPEPVATTEAVVETPPPPQPEIKPAPVETLVAGSESVDPPTPAVEAAEEATAVAPVPETPAPAKASLPAPTQTSRDEIVFTLKQLEITAVMGDGSKARIMSGGQIYGSGELINLDLKIRFQGKKGAILYFSDAAGEVYEKKL